MKLTVQSQDEKPLMHRTDYVARVESPGTTPSRQVLAEALAKQVGTDKALIVVRQINPAFGESASTVSASVYKNADAMAQYEPAYMKKRHEDEPAPAAEEAPKEDAPAEDTPKEEPSEEKPADAPSEEKSEEAPEEKSDEEPKAPEEKPEKEAAE